MTKYCDACHTANKDHARYCCLCKGKFSGVRFGAHISANAFHDASAGQGQAKTSQLSFKAPIRARAHTRRSVPRRTGLLLVFVVLMLGPFTYWDSNRSSELWPEVKNSVIGAWHQSVASIDGALRPLLTATSTDDQSKDKPAITATTTAKATAERNRPRVANDSAGEGPAPTDAPLTGIASPAGGAGSADATECSEVRAALALCPQK